MRKSVILSMCIATFAATAAIGDVTSGPAVGSNVPELKVTAVTGEFSNQSIDYAAKRAAKPTLYVFVPAKKWTRPVARLIKKLDQEVTGTDAAAELVAVWITDDVAASKDYLPKAQQSMQLQHTSLTVFDGPISGPQDWIVAPEADVTVVVARDGRTVATFGFVSANDTVAKDVLAALKKP